MARMSLRRQAIVRNIEWRGISRVEHGAETLARVTPRQRPRARSPVWGSRRGARRGGTGPPAPLGVRRAARRTYQITGWRERKGHGEGGCEQRHRSAERACAGVNLGNSKPDPMCCSMLRASSCGVSPCHVAAASRKLGGGAGGVAASTGGSRAGRQSRSAWRTGGRFSLPIQRNAGSEGADAGETANADGTCPPRVGAATCWPCAWQRSPPAGAGADSSSHSSSTNDCHHST